MKLKEFKNGKKVSKEEIENWEKTNNIFLPDDYKAFLINFGTGESTDFYAGYEITYVKQIAEEMTYDKINDKVTYKHKIPHEKEYYAIFSFFDLEKIIEENTVWGNYEPNNSSLLIFASLFNNDFYCICIDKNSENYGKIYYTKSGYHYTFDYLQDKPQEYENLPCLENNFNNFVENIELTEE